MKKYFRKKQKAFKNFNRKVQSKVQITQSDNRDWEQELAHQVHEETTADQLNNLKSFIQTLLRDAEGTNQSQSQIKQALVEGYEAGVRDSVEGIMADLKKGLQAIDGDTKEAPPDRVGYYLGYQRALEVSVQHIREFAVAMGVYLITNNHL